MIGIVVVSHSWKLANEIINFATEMKQIDFDILNGSGLDENTYGSNPLKIKELIEENFNKVNGFIIICDIGSSVLNAKIAIDLIDEKYDKSKVIIADCPIVEGTIVATSSNTKEATIENIINELKQLKTFDKTK